MPKGSPKGRPKHGGRVKGTPNKATAEVREWTRAIFDDPEVRAVLHQQAAAGKLAPAIVNELLHYAYGKPRETLEVDTTMHLPDPRTLSTSELEDTILQHAAEIRAQRDAKKAGSARGS